MTTRTYHELAKDAVLARDAWKAAKKILSNSTARNPHKLERDVDDLKHVYWISMCALLKALGDIPESISADLDVINYGFSLGDVGNFDNWAVGQYEPDVPKFVKLLLKYSLT